MDRPEALDDVLRRLAVDLAAIDRETLRYHRKVAGLEAWTEFQAPADHTTRLVWSQSPPSFTLDEDVSEHVDPLENPAPDDDGSLHPRGPA